MARVRLCVCGSWFVGREGQAAHPRAPGQCLHFECRGAPARGPGVEMRGSPPLAPPLCVSVEKSTLPYLTSHPGPRGAVLRRMKRAPVSVQRGRMLEGGCSGSGYELLRRSKKAGTRRGHKARKQEIRHVKGGVGLGGLQLAGKKENRAPRGGWEDGAPPPTGILSWKCGFFCACGGGGRVHGAKCLATLAGVA